MLNIYLVGFIYSYIKFKYVNIVYKILICGTQKASIYEHMLRKITFKVWYLIKYAW